MTRTIAGVIGFGLATIFLLAQFAFWAGTSFGVVREHCLVADHGTASVESKWTYILFPPLFLSSIGSSRTMRSQLAPSRGARCSWHLAPPHAGGAGCTAHRGSSRWRPTVGHSWTHGDEAT